ncbi:MAG: hypothetical protein DHS20C17_36170 [Cyclobacteriaceae bacterium]|nr:MAG: hypothetical protein DHS20C17_36170 [Cyclobacteriaceae bacterium]
MKPLLRINRILVINLALCSFTLLFILGCSEDDSQPTGNSITIISMDPPSPANLVFYQTATTNDRVRINYNYNITHTDGARIWIQPFTGGSISDDFLYSPSPVLNGTGNREVIISIDEDNNSEVHVDQLRVSITDPDQNMDLHEEFINVDYTFTN